MKEKEVAKALGGEREEEKKRKCGGRRGIILGGERWTKASCGQAISKSSVIGKKVKWVVSRP